MNWNLIVGPATLIYLATVTVGGVWWASDLSARLTATERTTRESAETYQKITRLETLVGSMDKQLERIEKKIDDRR